MIFVARKKKELLTIYVIFLFNKNFITKAKVLCDFYDLYQCTQFVSSVIIKKQN